MSLSYIFIETLSGEKIVFWLHQLHSCFLFGFSFPEMELFGNGIFLLVSKRRFSDQEIQDFQQELGKTGHRNYGKLIA